MSVTKLIILLFISVGSCMNIQKGNDFLRSNIGNWKQSDKVIVLVRHAEKQSGDNPHLTEAGNQRAQKLATYLGDLEVKSIYSSDYNRTIETATPLANKLKKEPLIYNPRELQQFSDMLLLKEAGLYVVVGHSNTTPTLSNYLCNCDDFPSIDESDYTNIYVVVQRGDEVVTHTLKY